MQSFQSVGTKDHKHSDGWLLCWKSEIDIDGQTW